MSNAFSRTSFESMEASRLPRRRKAASKTAPKISTVSPATNSKICKGTSLLNTRKFIGKPRSNIHSKIAFPLTEKSKYCRRMNKRIVGAGQASPLWVTVPMIS